MASERSKRRDFLACIFITKSISKKLLIKINVVRHYITPVFKELNILTSLGGIHMHERIFFWNQGSHLSLNFIGSKQLPDRSFLKVDFD